MDTDCHQHERLLAALMSSTDISATASPILSGDEAEPLLANSLPTPSYTKSYQQNSDSMSGQYAYVIPDRGTILADLREFGDSYSVVGNPIERALTRCQEKVVKPYLRLLLLVGWQPVFSTPKSVIQKGTNVVYPLIVGALIVLGYIIQYASCFRRDRMNNGGNEDWTVTHQNYSGLPPCQKYVFSQYLIPDILHSAAYLYSFYTLRVLGSEQLQTLMERVFLMSAPTATGVRSQGRLIKKLRLLLYGSILWVVLSQVAQSIHVAAQYDNIKFYWLDPGGDFGKVVLLVFMCISFIALDVVYAATVINYCVQCYLLLFFMDCVKEKVREKSISLLDAMKEVGKLQTHVRMLNYHPGIAVSLVLINFGTMTALGSMALMYAAEHGDYSALMLVGTALAVIMWGAIMILSIISAAWVSAGLKSLKKLGHELRVRPFVYQNTTDEELDAFLLFMSSIRMAAKIFLIPVMSARLIAVLLIICITLLFLFQSGIIHVWL